MIRIHDKTEKTQAAHVLAKFSEMVHKASKQYDCSLNVEAYENGREHGYYLELWRKGFAAGESMVGHNHWALAFSEYRMTDDIVVYVGLASDFNREGHVPSEESYAAKKFFKRGDYTEAAAFIFGYLVDLKEHRR